MALKLSNMAVCSEIKEIGLKLDKELNNVLEKKYSIKENIKANIKEKNLKVLRVISEKAKNKKVCDLNLILLNVDSDLLDNSDVLVTLERLVDYRIISSKLYAGKRSHKLSATMCDIFSQNPKQNQQNKHNLARQDVNNNRDNPSNNGDILVHLSDIKGDINCIKTSIKDAFPKRFNFFKSELQKKKLVE